MKLAEQLAEAKQNLADIQEEFKDKPELLAVYEPFALDLIRLLEG